MKSSFAPRRKHLRVAWRLPAKITVIRDQAEISATVFNISSAGVLLFATEKLPWNGLVNVQLEMEGHEPSVVNYRGVVRRMGLEREGLVAIVFEEMSDTETARLRECVMKRALNQITYLSQFAAFRDLSDLDLLALTSVCHELHLKCGMHVAKFGDQADSVFLVKRGAVQLLAPQSPDGETKAQEVEVARAGQLFGEASALLKLPHNLDVVAIEDTELLLIPAAAMVYLRDHHPSLAVSLYEIFAAFMGRRIRRLTGRLFSPLAY